MEYDYKKEAEGVGIDKDNNMKYQYTKYPNSPAESYRFAAIRFDPIMDLTIIEHKYDRRSKNWLK